MRHTKMSRAATKWGQGTPGSGCQARGTTESSPQRRGARFAGGQLRAFTRAHMCLALPPDRERIVVCTSEARILSAAARGAVRSRAGWAFDQRVAPSADARDWAFDSVRCCLLHKQKNSRGRSEE